MKNTIKQKEEAGKGMFFQEDDKGMMGQLDYTLKENGVMAIDHTEVREDMQGEGLAGKLLDHTVNYAKENKLKVDPICSYAASKFKKNSDYQAVQV